ncbi:MAG: hypothetical protein WB630_24110, partial [Candidatus Acidiferrales bacterium]
MCEKVQLAIGRICLSALSAPHIMPVAFQMMRFPFVCQLNVKDLFQSINQLGIADGKQYLDAMTQIASHEVGAA